MTLDLPLPLGPTMEVKLCWVEDDLTDWEKLQMWNDSVEEIHVIFKHCSNCQLYYTTM